MNLQLVRHHPASDWCNFCTPGQVGVKVPLDMSETHDHVFSKMRSLYGSMSRSERRIADFLFSSASTGAYLTLSELGRFVGTSESTIVRFSRKLDYSGFASFKRALLSDVLSDKPATPTKPFENLSVSDDADTVRRKLFSLTLSALADTVNNVDAAVFDQATNAIANAERTEIFANNQSGLVAHIAAHKFIAMGVHVTARTDRLLHQGYARFLSERHLAVFLSHSGKPEDLLEALRIAKRQGVKCVAITSSRQSPLALEADVHLLTSLPVATVGDEAGVIRIAQIALLECIALAVGHQKQTSHRVG
jgi:RpiR family transcriptional regulator, carbohydrate utilization regulator